MPTLTEGMHAGEALGEFALGPAYHNDKVTVLSGQNLSANAVVGSVPSATVASAAKAGGNTGNGTFVVDATAPAQPRVIEGVYTLRCVTAVTNGGVFRLERPDGVVIGDVTIPPGAGNSITITENIKGVLTDGGTDFIVGDGFDIAVSALSEKIVEYDPAATNGGQIMRGILIAAVNATGGDAVGVVASRGPGTVNSNDLVWKSGLTTAQKDTAKRALLARGIRAL